MEILTAQNITKVFENSNLKVNVLNGISISFEKGKLSTVMGASGSGKSTFLYILGGLLEPTSGQVVLDGRVINKLSDAEKSEMRRRDIGFVFQFYNLIPVLDVEENVAMPLLLDKKDVKKYKSKIDFLIEKVGLKDRRKHRPYQLSGGEQQRVAIARALVTDPKVILADEPTGNLDSKSTIEIMELLKSLSKDEGKTIVMVTHDHQVAGYSDVRINICDGRIAG